MHCLFGRRRREARGRIVRTNAVQSFLRDVVEERIEFVEFLRQQGIEFVVVAFGTTDRHAQPHRAQRIDPVHHVFIEILVGIRAAFVGGHVVANEPGGDALLPSRVGQQIARQLLDGEGVVRLVLIESVDHPVAPQPHEAHAIEMIAAGVRVAGQVQPVDGHPFAVVC